MADGKSVKSCVAYLKKKTKFRLALQLSLLRRSRLKSARASPVYVLKVLQISCKSVYFRRSHIRTREHRQTALESESNIRLKPSFEPNNNGSSLSFNDAVHSTMSLHARPAAFALVSQFSPRVACATYLHSAEYAVETCSSVCLSVTLEYCTSTWLNLSFIKQG